MAGAAHVGIVALVRLVLDVDHGDVVVATMDRILHTIFDVGAMA
jgi:hypothetical protein